MLGAECELALFIPCCVLFSSSRATQLQLQILGNQHLPSIQSSIFGCWDITKTTAVELAGKTHFIISFFTSFLCSIDKPAL